MGDVKRYAADEQYPGQYSARCDLVAASDFDAALAREAALREQCGSMQMSMDEAAEREAALREELATAKRNEHNSEVAYKAAIEKQEELREELAIIKDECIDHVNLHKAWTKQRDGMQQRLTAAEQRNAELIKACITIEVIVEKTAVHGQKRVNGVIVATVSHAIARGESALEVREHVIKILDSARYDQSIFFAAAKPTESGASE